MLTNLFFVPTVATDVSVEYLQVQLGDTSISLVALAEMEVKWVLPLVDL